MGKQETTRGSRQLARAIREHLRANVVGYLALFVALSGTAYAASKIGPSDIASNAVRSKHIKSKNVKTPDLANNSVTATKLACEGNSNQDVMVRAGAVCIDRYESSIWTAKVGGTRITGPIPCSANGQDCKGEIFARSVKGVAPRGGITWFQAQAALANSRKRLPSNAEWQQAALGTPDSTACNVNSGEMKNTGAEAGCVSAFGVNDMVGNLWEWVADWDEQADGCADWPASFGSDATCFGTGTPSRFPGALVRGGYFSFGSDAGPFAVAASIQPSDSDPIFGFRGAR